MWVRAVRLGFEVGALLVAYRYGPEGGLATGGERAGGREEGRGVRAG